MSMRSNGARAIAAALAFFLSATAQVANGAKATAELKIGESYAGLDTFAEPTAPPFPLSIVTEPPLDREAGHFAYADEAGRVRAFVVTRGPNTRNNGKVDLRWVKKFRKNAVTDTARFTVNKSWLFVETGGAPPQRQQMQAHLQMLVDLKDDSQRIPLVRTQMPNGQLLTWVRPPAVQEQFSHSAQVGTSNAHPSPVLWREHTLLFGDTFYEYWPDVGVQEPESWKQVQSSVRLRSGNAYYETAPYRGEIDLSDVPVGSTYDVLYRLVVSAQDDAHESVSLAQLGDPLDVDSGFIIETDSTPLDDDVTLQLCDAQSDAERFAPNTDLTAMTDRYTGLTWQRCPLGYTLNLNGTLNELSDDRCEAGNDTRSTWQSALQRSVDNSVDGQTDWRVPNIKELESIVEASCSRPAIDTVIFPATVRSEVWSATPTPGDGASAEVIHFSFGETTSLAQTALADVRLVRTDANTPVQRRVGVLVGRPTPLVEGNDGMRALSFPIMLDAPASSDVSIAYSTRDNTASAGEDYVAASGTLLISAGATSAEVQVTVLGDLIGEPNESVILSLDEASSNAYVRIDRAAGQIIDDEPIASVMQSDAVEPQSGTESISFDFVLDRPAVTDVTLNYEVLPGTATAGVDYLSSQNGEIVFPAGERIASTNRALLLDPLVEGDEYLVVRLTGVSENARIGATSGEARAYIIDADDTPWLSRLNDTGIDRCADADNGFLSCPQPGFPGQDAEQGRDFTLNNYADGAAGFVFTKLDVAGAPLPDQDVQYNVTPWDCVRDEHTGLHWEVKTDDGGLRDKDWIYTWYNSTGINDGGRAGVQNGGSCVDATSCDTEKFVAAVNVAGICGFNDWRLPTRDELLSIVMQNGIFSQAPYDPEYFPNTLTLGGYYLTATPRAKWDGVGLDDNFIWSIYWDRGQGEPRDRSKSLPNPVRLVRGAP